MRFSVHRTVVVRRNLLNKIAQTLSSAYTADEARELACWVIEYLSGKSRSDILCGLVDIESESIPWEPIVDRLMQHEPIQYIIGQTAWMGLRLKVTQDTLIPRAETAELVEWVEERVPAIPIRLLDIGTGTGCIAIALKRHCPLWDVTAMDFSLAALEVARANARLNEVDIRFEKQDILEDYSYIPYDVVVSNPPYVRPSDEVGAEVRLWEPSTAVFVPEDDPLLFYRRIITMGIGKQLFFEVNECLAGQVADCMQTHGYADIEIRKDIYGKERMVSGRTAC